MLRISFESFEFTFECFESLSNGSNVHANASNHFRILRICNPLLRIPFEWLEFALDWFGSLLNDSKLDSKASNPFRMV